MYKVSIIIPVYNGVGKLDKCLKSLKNQTIDNLEVIFIDDGSKDDSFIQLQELIRKYHKKNFKYRIIRQDNHGIANTRNLGIKMATGKYIMFSDQDDFFTKHYISRLYNKIESNNDDIVVGGYERVTLSNGAYKTINRVVSEGKIFDKYQIIAPWAHIYRREFILENNLKFLDTQIGEDLFFTILAYSKTTRLSYVGGVDYKWFYNNESVSNNVHKTISHDSDPEFLIESLLDNMDKESLSAPLTEYYFYRFICWYLLYSFRGSNKTDIKEMYNKLFRILEANFPNYKQNKYIKKIPDGESLKVYMCVRAFSILHNLNVMLPLMLLLA